jgi:integrase
MATVKYVLLKGSINIKYSHSKQVYIRKTTGLRPNKTINWIEKSQKIRECREEPNAKLINAHLSEIRSGFEKRVNELISARTELTNDTLIQEFEVIIGKKTRKQDLGAQEFLDLLESYTNPNGILVSSTSGKVINLSTQKAYKSTLVRLLEFQKEAKYKLRFKTINLEFYNKFQEWCAVKGYTSNSFGKFIKNIKAIMNAGLEQRLHENRESNSKRFKTIKLSSESVFLNENELQKLMDISLPLDSIEDRVRDWFLIGACTALRVSDFTQLTTRNLIEINGIPYIETTAKKTKKAVSIPFKPMLKLILEKRNNNFPMEVHENAINKYIKIIGEKAGINEVVEVSRIELGGEKKTFHPKFELIRSHTARRSFCTNAYLAGMDASKIMNISGHTKLETFLEYVKADHLRKGQMLDGESFFRS